eukprot:gene2891-1128_t
MEQVNDRNDKSRFRRSTRSQWSSIKAKMPWKGYRRGQKQQREEEGGKSNNGEESGLENQVESGLENPKARQLKATQEEMQAQDLAQGCVSNLETSEELDGNAGKENEITGNLGDASRNSEDDSGNAAVAVDVRGISDEKETIPDTEMHEKEEQSLIDKFEEDRDDTTETKIQFASIASTIAVAKKYQVIADKARENVARLSDAVDPANNIIQPQGSTDKRRKESSSRRGSVARKDKKDASEVKGKVNKKKQWNTVSAVYNVGFKTIKDQDLDGTAQSAYYEQWEKKRQADMIFWKLDMEDIMVRLRRINRQLDAHLTRLSENEKSK